MWYNEDTFCEKPKCCAGKRSSPSSGAGFLDIGNSHSLGEMALKAGLKGPFNLGRIGASKAIKSDFAKQKMKGMASKYLDQALDSFTSDLSKKLDPLHGGAFDIHKAIGKLPKPKKGWTPGQYKFMGPYNPLDKQLEYNKDTGEITKWHATV